MINLNTNLSSLITQQSLAKSTQRLNQAIEQMTTGFKINHAKDNAANYNITTNMTTKIGAYMVAEDNCAMGLNLISTAEGSLNTISDKLSRLRALAVQTQNGTYGEQSKQAINQEAESLVTEIKREYLTTEYNGLKLFNVEKEALEAQETAFIEDPVTYDQAYVDNLTAVSSVTGSFTESEYKIAEVKDLVALATLTNSGVDTTDVTFILAKDLDIGAYCDEQLANGNGGWTPIGTSSSRFKGVFDGNGHIIENLKFNRTKGQQQGLFGYTETVSRIKNLGIEECDVRAFKDVGGLVGCAFGTIENCFVTGKIEGEYTIGGLVGGTYNAIKNSYSTSIVDGFITCGGLVGYATNSSISNSYATGSVFGCEDVGGLVGSVYSESIINSYASGAVTINNSTGTNFGGLVGFVYGTSAIKDSYATADIKGQKNVGGFIGHIEGGSITIENSHASGTVEGYEKVGGFAGYNLGATVKHCYATGVVKGNNNVAGLVGTVYNGAAVVNCYATGSVSGTSGVYGLVANVQSSTITNGASIQADSHAGVTVMSLGDIKANYSHDYMGKTNINRWVIKDDTPHLDWEYTLYKREEEGFNLDGANVVSFQVGVNSGASSGMSFDLAFSLIEIDDVMTLGLADSGCLSLLDSMILRVSDKAIEYGAMQNRLESALDEISVQYENLVSSRSTLRDADISEVSSEYIRQQILQQASATLMATANQSPSIALQLI